LARTTHICIKFARQQSAKSHNSGAMLISFVASLAFDIAVKKFNKIHARTMLLLAANDIIQSAK